MAENVSSVPDEPGHRRKRDFSAQTAERKRSHFADSVRNDRFGKGGKWREFAQDGEEVVQFA
jgi:hypothetical protein